MTFYSDLRKLSHSTNRPEGFERLNSIFQEKTFPAPIAGRCGAGTGGPGRSAFQEQVCEFI